MNYEDMKIPPHSIADEQSILGGLLLSGLAGDERDSFAIVTESVGETDFYRQDHRLIFRAFASLIDANSPLDLVTVTSWLSGKGELENAGGFAYLATMAKDTPSAANIAAYASNVKRMSIKRQFIGKLEALQAMAFSSSGSSEAELSMLLEQAGSEVSRLEMSMGGGDKSMTLQQAEKQALKLMELYASKRGGVIGIDTGLQCLNDEIGGWHDTDLIVIDARSGMGKTAAAMTFAKGAAKAGHKVGFISTEMASQQLGLRRISQESGVSMVDIRRGHLEDEHWGRIGHAISSDVKSGTAARIRLNDSALELDDIKRQAKAWKRDFGMNLLIVDYLQNIRVSNRRGVSGDKTAEVMAASSELKQLAKSLGIPVIALAQVKRDVDQRSDKRPQKSDVMWAGQIEQDADVMIGMYRHKVYNPDFGGGYNDVGNIAEWIIQKNRHGSISTQYSVFIPARIDFVDAEPNGIMDYLDELKRSNEQPEKKRSAAKEAF